VGAGNEGLGASGLHAIESEQVVTVGGDAVEEVEGPAAKRSALGNDDSVRALGHDYLGRDGVGLVLEIEDCVLGHPRHAAEEHLRGTLGEFGPARNL
jgi:hypothetical protein